MTRARHITYVNADGKQRTRYVQEQLSEYAKPVACFMIHNKKYTSVTPAATALAKMLAQRVLATLRGVHDPESKDQKYNYYAAEGRQRYLKLYNRARPIAKRYVMKYLR